jgi:aerobic-type carbon monoxide dehydrogenase small subunit (CoxS/CutS family)
VQLTANGAGVDVDDRHLKTPLLLVLRDVLGMHGTKSGCGRGYCEACTVLIDGRSTRSCRTTAEPAAGTSIVTVEGVSFHQFPMTAVHPHAQHAADREEQ